MNFFEPEEIHSTNIWWWRITVVGFFPSVSRLRENIIDLGSAFQDGIRNGAEFSPKPNVPSVRRKWPNLWVELSDWKIPTQLSPAFWHFSAMLPAKGYNVTDISQAAVAVLGFMGVTTLTSNTQMTKKPRETSEANYGCSHQWLPCAHRSPEEHGLKYSYFPKWQALPAKGLLEERHFASSCQSPGSSFQSVAGCQLHSPLSCWICQVSLVLYHCAFLPISKLHSPFPMSLHLAFTQ